MRGIEAAEKRSAWSHAIAEHGAICSEFGLPHTVEELSQVRQATAEAGSACRRLSDLLTDLGKLAIAHKEAVGRAGDRTTEREEAEARAAGEWAVWHRKASEFEAVRASIGQEAEAAKAELRESRESHRSCPTSWRTCGQTSRVSASKSAPPRSRPVTPPPA